MVRFHINVNYGDADTTKLFWFVHKNYQNLSDDEQALEFDKAVKELDRIYKTYGRFATTVGIKRLFDSFGFEESVR